MKGTAAAAAGSALLGTSFWRQALADAVPLVVDTRNAFARLGIAGAHIVKA